MPSPFVADAARVIRNLDDTLAFKAYQAGIPFLDARRSDEYAEGHIARAWCLPVWESDIETRITIFEAGAKTNGPDPLVIYCNGGDCEDSNLLAERLTRLGYRNLWIYREGYPAWVQQGRPTAKGAQP
jgi:rhodanese-related sulfurtransferase